MKQNTDLKSSLKVLVTLYIMIKQDFDALLYYEDNISEDIIDRNVVLIAPKDITLDSTIVDSLRFSIVLKACSFLEEWDDFLGVRNEPNQIDNLRKIKKTVASARRAVNYWKDLKTFRNEIIAHNFRSGKSKEVKIDMLQLYDCPQTIPELYFLMSFLNRMIEVLFIFFKEKVNEIVVEFNREKIKVNKTLDEKIVELQTVLDEIDDDISKSLSQYSMDNIIEEFLNRII